MASPQHQTTSPFALLGGCLPARRRSTREGASIYRAGTRLEELHLIRSGVFKVVAVTQDGREKLLALRFSGDWLGFDGIAEGHHVCDASVVEPGEIWSVRYDELLRACIENVEFAAAMRRAMSEEIARDRDSMKALCTPSADARVAAFLHAWIETLSRGGVTTDRITLRLTRAEIGNYLGLRMESVSRAFSRLAREDVIRFAEPTHREVEIRDVDALSRFVQGSSGTVHGLIPC